METKKTNNSIPDGWMSIISAGGATYLLASATACSTPRREQPIRKPLPVHNYMPPNGWCDYNWLLLLMQSNDRGTSRGRLEDGIASAACALACRGITYGDIA